MDGANSRGPFVVDRWVARGGMGDVYRGHHRETMRGVAIKEMNTSRAADAQRFALEARALRDLQHDAIVGYLDDGTSAEGIPWLAMEWLEGEDLGQRLARGPLTVEESILLVRRVAQGLSHAHAHGVVHRDLKPSNLFLVDGDVSRVKILDFGLARFVERGVRLTSTHHILGTVAYMAPEQARGEKVVDARADLYSLGAVWFEALTGKLPFSGDHAFAVLAKLLLENAPRVRSVRRDVSAIIDDLIAELLARDPEQRPLDALTLERAIDSATAPHPSSSSGAKRLRTAASVTLHETRFGSVILLAPARAAASESTIDGSWIGRSLANVESIAKRFDGEALALSIDAVIVTLPSASAPADGAARAAACAMALAEEHPSACIALSAGAIERAGRTPAGIVIDRAVAIVRECHDAGVWTDDSTARLLARRFVLEPRGLFLAVRSRTEHERDDRTLLGRRTPFVGRDRELALLEATLRECIGEPVVRSVLITAPPGAGKSRLRLEFLARIENHAPSRVLAAFGDPLSPGAALSLARQLIRSAAGLRDGDPGDAQRSTLRTHLASHSLGTSDDALLDALADVAGVSVATHGAPDGGGVDPDRHRERSGLALARWLDAIIASGPMIFVLEDLHWGDLASVDHLLQALRRADESPTMLLAFARPEVRKWLPGGRLAPNALDIPLEGLTRRAAEKLTFAVLGTDADASAVARIVHRADGNAFHLEELIRRSVEWGDDDLPETVFALLQSRLDDIGAEPRRALRAASVFGERFWVSGVQRLLAHDDPRNTEHLLDQLVAHEIVEPARESRFPGEREYGFRHALLRDAAYATLIDSDRAAAHRLAGEWLLASGEHQPNVLAAHFERGGDPERALPFILAAADVAFTAYQLDEAIGLAQRGIEYGAAGGVRGRLFAIVADVLTWKSDPEGAYAAALEGVRLCERGSPHWFLCASLVVLAAMNQQGAEEGAMEVLQGVLTLDRAPEPTGRCAFAIAMIQYGMLLAGQRELMERVLEPLRAAARAPEPHDGEFTSWHKITEGYVALYCRNRPGDALRLVREGATLSIESKAVPGVEGRGHLAGTLNECGAYAEAEVAVRDWIVAAELRDMDWMVGLANATLIRVLVGLDRIQEAIALGKAEIDDPIPTNADLKRYALAEGLFAAGRLDDAEALSRSLTEQTSLDAVRIPARLVLARVALARGIWQDALAHADAGLTLLETAAAAPDHVYGLLYVRARSLHATARVDEGLRALAAARALLAEAVSTIESPRDRDCFLSMRSCREVTQGF